MILWIIDRDLDLLEPGRAGRVETELQNLDSVRQESARFYESLQKVVDQQIQKTGFGPAKRLRHGWRQELLQKAAGPDRENHQ